MIRIALQSKGRLREASAQLLCEIGVQLDAEARKLLVRSADFPVELLFLRDDDIPAAVASGAADLGIVGENEWLEKEVDAPILRRFDFGCCRMSIALPEGVTFESPDSLAGMRIATSYPKILRKFLTERSIQATISEISGSVEVAPSAGMADAVFDIVESGSTLRNNGLREVFTVVSSQAVLISNARLGDEKQRIVAELLFRLDSIARGRGMKYLVMNLPAEKLTEAAQITPGMRSPTVVPLAQPGWLSVHVVVAQNEVWNKISALKTLGAEDILVLSFDKIVL